jgi:hypothetical protein
MVLCGASLCRVTKTLPEHYDNGIVTGLTRGGPGLRRGPNRDEGDEARQQETATTLQVTLSERQKTAIAKAADLNNETDFQTVANEPNVCADCQKSTDPKLFANFRIHKCHMKSCQRYLHSAVLCPYAAFADDDGHYFCRPCIESVTALKVLKSGLAVAPSGLAVATRGHAEPRKKKGKV